MSNLFKINNNNRIFGLDIVRAIAILLVVFAHGIWIISTHFPNIESALGISGFLGVEIFFVLSGFLIGYIFISTFEKQEQITYNLFFSFWKRRWFRTLPNYYLIFLINIIIAFCTNTSLPIIFKHFFFLQNFYIGSSFFFAESWSLTIEEWFYILFPICVWLLFRILHIKKFYILLIIAFSFIIICTSWRIWRVPKVPNEIYWWDVLIRKALVCRLDAIMYGVLMAILKYYQYRFWRKNTKILFCIGIIILSFSIYASYTFPINFYIKTFYFSGYSIGFALILPKFDSIKSGPRLFVVPITFISIISYSLYLIHFSIFSAIIKIFYEPTSSSFWRSLLVYSFYWIGSILVSSFLYIYFEKPITDLRENKKNRMQGKLAIPKKVRK